MIGDLESLASCWLWTPGVIEWGRRVGGYVELTCVPAVGRGSAWVACLGNGSPRGSWSGEFSWRTRNHRGRNAFTGSGQWNPEPCFLVVVIVIMVNRAGRLIRGGAIGPSESRLVWQWRQPINPMGGKPWHTATITRPGDWAVEGRFVPKADRISEKSSVSASLGTPKPVQAAGPQAWIVCRDVDLGPYRPEQFGAGAICNARWINGRHQGRDFEMIHRSGRSTRPGRPRCRRPTSSKRDLRKNKTLGAHNGIPSARSCKHFLKGGVWVSFGDGATWGANMAAQLAGRGHPKRDGHQPVNCGSRCP